MGLFDDPFDLNNDGRRSLDEDYLEFMMFNEFMNKHDEQDDNWDSSFEESYDENDEIDFFVDEGTYEYEAVTKHSFSNDNMRNDEEKKRAELFRNKIPAAADPEILANFDNQLTRFTETKKKQKKGRSFRILVAVLIMIALIVIPIITISIIRSVRENNRITSAYTRAEKYIAAENYQKALDELKTIEDSGYRDTEPLIRLCDAHIAYDAGEFYEAYRNLNGAIFYWQTPEMLTNISVHTNAWDLIPMDRLN